MKTTKYADMLITEMESGRKTSHNPFRRDGNQLWCKYDAIRLEPAGKASRWVLLFRGKVIATEDTPSKIEHGDTLTITKLHGEIEVYRSNGHSWYETCPTCERPWR